MNNIDSPLHFTSENGVIMCNGERFKISGINHFGCETDMYVPHGLWAQKMEILLDWCRDNKFNAIRVPFAVDFALNPDSFKTQNPRTKKPTVNLELNPDLKDLTCGQVLDKFVKAAADRGLLILLDMHHLYGTGDITEVWADKKNPESLLIKAWKNMITRYNYWNVFAIDIKNEPHGRVTWGDNNPDTDWAAWCERCGNAILEINPNLLIFCEGIDKYINNEKNQHCFPCWGGALQWVAERPINLKNPKKLVYSPHQYGPNITKGQGCVGDDKLENNFGFIRDMNKQAVVVGEWGGDECDYKWQEDFADYLVKIDIIDNFHWSLNPNSGDTKGLVEDDWKTTVTKKLDFCRRINPTPTIIDVIDGKPTIVVEKKPHDYKKKFLDLHHKLHNPKNGYFSPEGIPYHSIETLMVEAPDHGHETTSEAFSYYVWVEALYGRLTGDWSFLKKAWDTLEKQMIPTKQEQPTNDGYKKDKPATFAAEHSDIAKYPSQLEINVPIGNDPIANDIISKHGYLVYGMHWLKDCDNWYGFGAGNKSCYINTFQRGAHEGVFKTIPQPSWESFKSGGPNGFLDIFARDNNYTKQWRYTNAPDADSRAIQAIYWAKKWADETGGNNDVDSIVVKAAKMGDWLRYAMFDKYFKPLGCQDKNAKGGGYDACHYLLSWYYSWGGPLTSSGWAWKIGSSHNHFGYQNPFAAWVLAKNSTFNKYMSDSAPKDWDTSLKRQIQMYYWLQSSEGPIAGGCTNCYNGDYSKYPEGKTTFFGMLYDEAPVYLEPPSNGWFGFQVWSMERMIQYYYESKDISVKALVDKWVSWITNNTKTNPNVEIPSGISWTGQPDENFSGDGIPSTNKNLHVKIESYQKDLGIMSGLARCLIYYSLASGDEASRDLANIIMDSVLENEDGLGYSVPEKRPDYVNKTGNLFTTGFDTPVSIPNGYNGKMPNGDIINTSSTFLSIRSKFKQDPQWPIVQKALDDDTIPIFVYHRYWSQAEIALTLGMLALGDPSDFTQLPDSQFSTDKQTPCNLIPTPISIPEPTPTPTLSDPNKIGGVTVTPTVTNSWNSDNKTIFQLNIDITNTTSATIKDIVISKPKSIVQFWNMTDNLTHLSFPDWKVQSGLGSGETYTWGGQFSEIARFEIIEIKK
jgi:aryl-phospho-beta-D-glucosidase BglC (GH1 family)